MGEEGVVSLKNVTAATRQKFYAYASCFVDVTNKTGNAFKTHFAGGTSENSQYVTQNAYSPILSDANGDWSLMSFYDNMQAKLAAGTLTSARADNLKKLTFVCEVNGETKSMKISEWITYLVAQGLYTPAA